MSVDGQQGDELVSGQGPYPFVLAEVQDIAVLADNVMCTGLGQGLLALCLLSVATGYAAML